MVVETNTLITKAKDWFAGGRRVVFDPCSKTIVSSKKPGFVSVFERVRMPTNNNDTIGPSINPKTQWLTMLPGFPDGSYGFSRIDQLMEQHGTVKTVPTLYIEYVGQGDSDKPTSYMYSTVERADLVEAQWRAHDVQKTSVVTFDYSSLVLMELMRRQQEDPSFPTKIENILMINGGLFADGHSHPWTTTPLLQTWFGRMGAKLAQTSDLMFNIMMEPLWSKSYRRDHHKAMCQEMMETETAIRLQNGTVFLANAAGFVKEHKKNSDRWDLYNIYASYLDGNASPTIRLVGSQEDPFEYRQINLAQKRMKRFHPKVMIDDRIPGGHLSTWEQAEKIMQMIKELVSTQASNAHTASTQDYSENAKK